MRFERRIYLGIIVIILGFLPIIIGSFTSFTIANRLNPNFKQKTYKTLRSELPPEKKSPTLDHGQFCGSGDPSASVL